MTSHQLAGYIGEIDEGFLREAESWRPGRGRKKLLLAGLLAALLALLGAAATITPVVRDFFGGGGTAYEKFGVTLGHTQTVRGCSVTLTDCVRDREQFCLGIEIVAPGGTELRENRMAFENVELEFPEDWYEGLVFLGSYTMWEVPDERLGDNRASMLLAGWFEESPEELRALTVILKNLGHWTGGEDDRFVTDCPGTWRFRIQVPEAVRGLSLRPDTALRFHGEELTVEEVILLPMRVRVILEGDARSWSWKALQTWRYAPDQGEEALLSVYKKDGSRVDGESIAFIRGDSSQGIEPPGKPELLLSLRELLDPAEVDHVEVCGVSIPIPAQEGAEAERTQREREETMNRKKIILTAVVLCCAAAAVCGIWLPGMNRNAGDATIPPELPRQAQQAIRRYMADFSKGSKVLADSKAVHYEDDSIREAIRVAGDKLGDYRIESAEQINEDLYALAVLTRTRLSLLYQRGEDGYERYYGFVGRIGERWYYIPGVSHIPPELRENLDPSRYDLPEDENVLGDYMEDEGRLNAEGQKVDGSDG